MQIGSIWLTQVPFSRTNEPQPTKTSYKTKQSIRALSNDEDGFVLTGGTHFSEVNWTCPRSAWLNIVISVSLSPLTNWDSTEGKSPGPIIVISRHTIPLCPLSCFSILSSSGITTCNFQGLPGRSGFIYLAIQYFLTDSHSPMTPLTTLSTTPFSTLVYRVISFQQWLIKLLLCQKKAHLISAAPARLLS